MHSDQKSDKPSKCNKCGMNLVLEIEVGKEKESYLPIYIIVALIVVVSFVVTISADAGFDIYIFLKNFMAGFFLIFAMFKLIDLKGFAEGYATYDLLAKRFYSYGYLYPFIELFFGLSMIAEFYTVEILWAEVFVMIFSGTGVLIKLLNKEKFRCVCLGTVLKVPLTKVTLVEDFGMAALAVLMIIIS